MKKLTAILMAIILTAALAACSRDKEESDSYTGAAAQAKATADSAAATEPFVFVRDPDAIYDYETREIWCENNGNRIYGVAYVPVIEGVEKFPLVIHAHGMGSNHEAGEGYCKRYAEKGFAAYTFDFPGGSKLSTENKSDGDIMKMSAVTEASDLQAILDTALTWDFVDTDNVFLEGGSMGGLVATMVGLDNTDTVKGMILHYPSLYMPQLVTASFTSVDDIPETISFSEDYELSGVFVRDLWGLDVVDRLDEFPGSVTIIQGSEDVLVPAYLSEEASGLFVNAEYHVIEGAGHGFGGDDFETAAQYGLDYLYANT